jgi:hypothetical protein
MQSLRVVIIGHVPPERPWQLSRLPFIELTKRSASELEASCTKTLGRFCMLSCMKDTAAPDRKGADCHGRSTILMCALNEAISCSLASFVVSLVVFLAIFFGWNLFC